MAQEKRKMDQDVLYDLLYTERYLTNLYNDAANESSSNSVQQQMLNLLSSQHNIYSSVYGEMSKRGWIQNQPAEYEKLKQLKQNYLDQLDYL